MAGFISAGTASAIAAGASLAGTGASVAGKLKGGQASRAGSDAAAAAAAKMAQYQAQVARNNKIIAERAAEYAIETGQQRAAIQSMKGAAAAGTIKARQAANGLDVNAGTNVDVRVGQREAETFDSANVLHKAQLENYGYMVQAGNYEAEARLQDAKAGFAQQSIGAGGDYGAGLGAAGSLLAGASALPLNKWLSGNGDTATAKYDTIGGLIEDKGLG